MHEIRSSVFSGNGSRQESPLVHKKAKLPGGRNDLEEGVAASLMTVPIPRFESRSSNHRQAERQPNVVESASLTVRDAAYDVRVVNVSAAGAMIQTEVEVFIGEPVDVQFPDCNRLRANVRWVKDGRIGIEFREQTEIIASANVREAIRRPFIGLVTTNVDGEEPGQQRARAARVGLVWNGMIDLGGVETRVRLRNISGGGAMLECEQDIAIGTPVCLDLADAGRIDADVRWSQGGHVGIHFHDNFDLQRLSLARPAGFVTEDSESENEEG